MTLPVIGIGKRGGKIVGYDKRTGKPVYQGSKAAQKLEAQAKSKAPELTKELVRDLRWWDLGKVEQVRGPASDKLKVLGLLESRGSDVLWVSDKGKKLLEAMKKPAEVMATPDPKLVMTVEGWPKKKDTYTIKHPGILPTDPKVKWPAGYPGEGFKAEALYRKGKYQVQFLEKGGKIAVKITYPDKSTKTWDSPNKAADSMYLHSRGLPLDMSATEKKKRGVSLPAKTAFGVNKFRGELPLLPGRSSKDRTLADLDARGDVAADATEVTVGSGKVPRPKRPQNDKGKVFKQGEAITKKRRSLGQVSLAFVAQDRYEIRFNDPKTGKPVVEEFKSINGASDHVWLVEKGYESRLDYLAKTGAKRIPSGGGWGFWGLKPGQVTWLTPEPKPAGEVELPPPEQAKKQIEREKKAEDGWERMPEVETDTKEGRPKAHDAPDPVEDKKAKAKPVTFGSKAEADAAAQRKAAETGKTYKVVQRGKRFVVALQRRELSPEERALADAIKEAQTVTRPEGIDYWDDELAKANLLQWGDELAVIQEESYDPEIKGYVKDMAGFSVTDMKNWGFTSGTDDLLALKMVLKKYKRQILAMYGDGYWQAGLDEPIPGWDRMKGYGSMPEFKSDLDADQKRAMALNWEYQTKRKKTGQTIMQLDADYPLQPGDVIRGLSPDGDPTEYLVDGFGSSFRTRKGAERYCYLKAPPRKAKAAEFTDEDVGNPQDKTPTGPDFEKTYQTRLAGKKQKLITQLPTDHGLKPGDTIKIKGEWTGFAEVEGLGGSFSGRTGQEQYVYLNLIQAKPDTKAGPGERVELSALDKLVSTLKTYGSGGITDKAAVTFDPDSGKWSFYSPFSEEYNALMSNTGGQITGITEWNPNTKGRETLDLALVEEVIEKIKEKLGWDVVVDEEALAKAQAARTVEEAELRKPIPEVEALLGKAPTGEPFELFAFQNQGVKFLDKTDGNALIGDSMGLGKTIQTLAWAAMRGKKVLVVCPKVVRRNWIKEGQKFFPDYFRGKELSPEELRKKGVPDLSGYNLCSVNYESVAKYADALKAAGFDTIVIDESHRIKNPKAKITNTLQAMAGQFNHHILLSGTAIKNKKEELFTQINMIKPGLFKSAKALRGDTIGGTWNKLQSVYIARQKMKVLPDLPEKINTVVEAPMSGPAAKNPDLNLELTFENIAKVKSALVPAKNRATIEMAKEIINSSDTNILIFTELRQSAIDIAQALGKDAILHHGQMSDDKREQAKEDFQEGIGRVFVSTRPSLEAGANMQQASQVIFNDLPWTPADIQQAEDRTHRIGQKDTVNSFWMTADHPLDQKITELIERKFTLAKKVTQGKQLSPEEIAWMRAGISDQELIAELRGEKGTGEDAAAEPSLAGWDRFEDSTTPWKQAKVISQDKLGKMPTHSLVRVAVQVTPTSPMRVQVYEKRSTNNWAMWQDGKKQQRAMEDPEIAQLVDHWGKTGGTVNFSTPQMKRVDPAEKEAPKKPKNFRKENTILIPSRIESWEDMLREAGIDDHDMAVYDEAFKKFLQSGKKEDRPPPYLQGEMDAINEHVEPHRKKVSGRMVSVPHKVSGPLEGFHELLKQRLSEDKRKRATWEDVESLLPIFRGIPGFEKLRVPEYARNILMEARLARELAEQEAAAEGEPEPEETLQEPEGPEFDPFGDDDTPFDIPSVGPEGFRRLESPDQEQLDALPVGATMELDVDPDTKIQLIKMAADTWQSKVTGKPAKLYDSLHLAEDMRKVEAGLDERQWWLDESTAEQVRIPEPEERPIVSGRAGEITGVIRGQVGPPPVGEETRAEIAAATPRRYRYGLSLRPYMQYMGGIMPEGAVFGDPPDASKPHARHGTVSFPEPLDPVKARKLDLIPILEGEAVDEAIEKIVAELSEYAAEHLENADEEPNYFRQVVGQAFEETTGGAAYEGDMSTFADIVKEDLAKVAAEQGAQEEVPTEPEKPDKPEPPEPVPEVTTEAQDAKKAIAAAALNVTESMTRPTRAGKQPRKVWEVSGNIGAHADALKEAGGRKWKGKWSFWGDPTLAIADALETTQALSVAEELEAKRKKAEVRAERRHDLADKAKARAVGEADKADKISERFWMGQPILVGHHSEKRARKDQQRMHDAMGRSVEEQKKAEYHERRAQAAESKASGEHSKVYIQRRIDQYETEVRDLTRRIDKGVSEEYKVRIGALRDRAQETADHWKGELAEKGGVQYSKANVKTGDIVVGRWGKAVVLRASPKTLSVKLLKDGPLKGNHMKYTYAELSDHFPATEETTAAAKGPRKMKAADLKPGVLDWGKLTEDFGQDRYGTGSKSLLPRDVLNTMPTGSKITSDHGVLVEKIGRGKYRLTELSRDPREVKLDSAEIYLRGGLGTKRIYTFEKSMPRFILRKTV